MGNRKHRRHEPPKAAPIHRKDRDSDHNRARNDILRIDGVVVDALGYENFRVELENGVEILASVSGRMRQNHIRILTGDRVQVELSPYDLTRGRIARRY